MSMVVTMFSVAQVHPSSEPENMPGRTTWFLFSFFFDSLVDVVLIDIRFNAEEKGVGLSEWWR